MSLKFEGLCPLIQVFDMPTSLRFDRGPNNPIDTSYGMKQLYLKDPDGYELCFQWRAT